MSNMSAHWMDPLGGLQSRSTFIETVSDAAAHAMLITHILLTLHQFSGLADCMFTGAK